jgi:peptide/nickel transport system ATP-binding protein
MSELLKVEDLCVDYVTGDGGSVRAVDHVSFSINEGQSLGLAGESGCGKSTIAYSLMRLHRPPALITNGRIFLEGRDILTLPDKELRALRWSEISMVFQSAMNCLNPVVTLEKQFYEIYKFHGITKDRAEAHQKAVELLHLVGIPEERLRDYPHQFSGGMRQRAVIAMALALKPKLLILDEPTTALDTVVQREILRQIFELKNTLGFSILFITHDISLMMEFCDTVAIMYAGKLIEQADSRTILHAPHHPYTNGLKNSFPSLHGEIHYMEGIPGVPLDLRHVPEGCRFAARCAYAQDICRKKAPEKTCTEHGYFFCHAPLNAQEEQK